MGYTIFLILATLWNTSYMVYAYHKNKSKLTIAIASFASGFMLMLLLAHFMMMRYQALIDRCLDLL